MLIAYFNLVNIYVATAYNFMHMSFNYFINVAFSNYTHQRVTIAGQMLLGWVKLINFWWLKFKKQLHSILKLEFSFGWVLAVD
jgi:hypothetical protein